MADERGQGEAPAIGVLISGRGSNLQALIDAIAAGALHARLAVVIANKADAQGLERARAAGVETLTISHRDHVDRDAFDLAIAQELRARGANDRRSTTPETPPWR